MFIWCAVLFILGLLAFADALFNMGEVFRRANSIVFLLISLALLIRTTTKIKLGKWEDRESRVFDLERRVRQLEAEKERQPDF
ncbi:MAG: hypothetical protein OEV49_05100 [candidate division Zixibacteria bacterium]|nr:hypothetical protein [candidate division Zixibacteria bacterium]MDH3936133.1 hypothetical protein [candidate division Zixibacteria bacterium]MDH4033276.1 hypothetical protein [candidate division Zixibacteria bacterium]